MLARLVWPSVEALREALEEIDTELDRALTAELLRDPLAALCREIEACGDDETRALRAIDAFWRHAPPPASRAAAALVDLLRAYTLGKGRVAVYRFLVTRGADVRGPLSDDTVLSPGERLEVLSAFAARHADMGLRRAIEWGSDALASLRRALADWTSHATHPRQIFYRFRARTGLHERPAYLAAIRPLATTPLAPEVREQFYRELAGEPTRLAARPTGPGRYECALCGEQQLAVTARHYIDPSDPAQGAETEYVCRVCGTSYFATWEIDTLTPSSPPAPSAWSIT